MTASTGTEVAEVNHDGGVDRPTVLDRNPRLAIMVFAALCAGSIALYLWAGRDQWFYLDDWDFLAGRRATSITDLLRPHNEHWSTWSMLAYRAMWSVVGLHAYWPYQLLAILNHLAIATLLRVVMRRAGVGPWLATAAAAVFLLFGAGVENAVVAFQVQFASPVTFGLLQLLAADHDGPIERRDWLGLLAGLVAISSSGIGVAMVVGVGVAVLLRRGWRAAAFQTAPLAAIYPWWWLVYGHDGVQRFHSTASQIVEFVVDVHREVFGSLSAVSIIGLLLVPVTVFGLGVAWRRAGLRDARRTLAAPIGLVAAGLVFAVATGYGRAWAREDVATTGRYLHVTAALVLPAVAVAIAEIHRHWPIASWVSLAALLAAVPVNVASALDYAKDRPYILGDRRTVLALISVPSAMEAPRELRPLGFGGKDVTMGWLQDGRRAGRIPTLEVVEPRVAQRAEWTLTFLQTDEGIETTDCGPVGPGLVRDLAAGDAIHLASGRLQLLDAQHPALQPLMFVATDGDTIRARAPVTVGLRSPAVLERAIVCE